MTFVRRILARVGEGWRRAIAWLPDVRRPRVLRRRRRSKDETKPMKPPDPRPLWRRMIPNVWIGVAAVVLVGALLLMVFPTRTWLQQRSDAAAAEQQLAEVQSRNAELEAQARRLESAAEIERIAREEYGLIKPGEQPYAVLPAPAPAQLPNLWPYTLLTPLVPPLAPAG